MAPYTMNVTVKITLNQVNPRVAVSIRMPFR